MNILDFIKKYFFWTKIRRFKIIWEHKKTAMFCRELINDYFKKKPTYFLKPKKKLRSQKIVWQYWGQGFDKDKLPPIVRVCFYSVDKFCGNKEYEIIRLSDENISEYIDIPQNIVGKFEKLHKAFFSDLLRCCLLTTYGGCWLDSTILLTGKIPDKYWNLDFFVFQRDNSEPNKKYWENAFAFYYGWGSDFKVKMLSSIFFCKKNNKVITDLRNILLFFWSENDFLPNYFFFQILFNELIETKYKDSNCLLEGDCIPHYLQQIINDDKFKISSLEDTLNLTMMHKLTYKCNGTCEQLVKLLNRIYLE